MSEPRVFFDTSALFAGVLSEEGAARALLKLGELHLISLWIGARVLSEADTVFRRKAPNLLPLLAGLLERANVQVGPTPEAEHIAEAGSVVSYAPDAYVLAEALACHIEYFATHDKAHFLSNPLILDLPLRVGSPGDVLGWLREGFSAH